MARSLAIRSSKMLLLCGYSYPEFQIPMRKSVSNSSLGIQTRRSDFLTSRFTVCVSWCCWGFHLSLIQSALSEPDVFGVKLRVTSAKTPEMPDPSDGVCIILCFRSEGAIEPPCTLRQLLVPTPTSWMELLKRMGF